MMGVCSSREEREAIKRNEQIDDSLRMEKKSAKRVIRLLLLGTSGCGKSTIIKQMRIIHGNGFAEEEIERSKGVIRANMVEQMSRILTQIKLRNITFQCKKSKDAAAHIFAVLEHAEYSDANLFSLMTVCAIRHLWHDPTVQALANTGYEFHLNESSIYFFNNLDRIASEDYKPSQQDILYNRVCTLGIVQIPLVMKNADFLVFDVGGQRSQRRKWIHCFDNVSAVIFMAAMNEYDQQMEEDESTNRMIESITLFESICNSPFFLRASMILFLNKKDLFLEKIKAGKTIRELFDFYDGPTGPDSYDNQAAFLTDRFLERKRDRSKLVYPHQVCATDTNQVEAVLDMTLDTILTKMLNQSGVV